MLIRKSRKIVADPSDDDRRRIDKLRARHLDLCNSGIPNAEAAALANAEFSKPAKPSDPKAKHEPLFYQVGLQDAPGARATDKVAEPRQDGTDGAERGADGEVVIPENWRD